LTEHTHLQKNTLQLLTAVIHSVVQMKHSFTGWKICYVICRWHFVMGTFMGRNIQFVAQYQCIWLIPNETHIHTQCSTETEHFKLLLSGCVTGYDMEMVPSTHICMHS